MHYLRNCFGWKDRGFSKGWFTTYWDASGHPLYDSALMRHHDADHSFYASYYEESS